MDNIIWWQTQTTLTVGVMILVVLLACRFLKRWPAVQHALWMLVLLKFLAPPIVNWPWAVDDMIQATAQYRNDSAESPKQSDSVGREESGNQESPILSNDDAAEGLGRLLPDDYFYGYFPAASVATASKWTEQAILLALTAWLIGVVLTALYQLRRIWQIRRIVNGAGPATPRLKEELDRMAALLGIRAPAAQISGHIRSPFICCFGRIRLLWPVSLCEDVTVYRSVIAHELAHVKRKDHWIAWLEFVAACIWWWNPLFWYVRRRLFETAEMSCDALALHHLPDDREQFAQAFLSLSQLESKSTMPAPALGAQTGTHLNFKRRLAMMLNENVNGRFPRWGMFGVCLLAIFALPAWLLHSSTGSVSFAAENEDADAVQVEALTSRYQVDKLEWVAEGRRLVYGGFKSRDEAEEGRGAEMLSFDGRPATRLPAIGTRWFAMSQDGKTMATVKRVKGEKLEFKIWGDNKLRNVKKMVTIKPDGELFQAYSFAYSPDGRMLATGGFSAKLGAPEGFQSELILIDLETGKVHANMAPAGGQIFTLAFSGDGKTLATGHRAFNKEDAGVRVWDVKSGELIREWAEGRRDVWRVAVSPDGQRIASVGSSLEDEEVVWNRYVSIHNTQTGELEHNLEGAKIHLSCVAFSPNGRFVAAGCGGEDNTVLVWDVMSGILLRTFKGHEGKVTAVAFAPDSMQLASGDQKKSVRIWNIADLPEPN